MASGISSQTGVSDYANTTDGRAAGVSALNAGAADSVGSFGVSVLFTGQPGAITHILAQDDSFITTESGNQLITE
jgi:hypothetical protein